MLDFRVVGASGQYLLMLQELGKGGGMTKSFCLLFFCPGFAVATMRGRRGSELLEGQPRPCLEWVGQQTQKKGRVKNFLGGHLVPHCVPSDLRLPLAN